MKRPLLFVAVLLLCYTSSMAQTTRQLIDSARAYKSKDFAKVISFATKAYDQSIASRQTKLAGESAFMRGVGNYLSGKYEESLRWYLESEHQYLTINDNTGLAELYADMTVFYLGVKKIEESDAISKKAVKYALLTNDKERLSTAINNRGLMFLDGGKIDSAATYFKKSYTLYKAINDKVGMSYSLDYLSSALAEQKQYQPALKALNESMKLRAGVGDKTGEAIAINNIGELYLKQNKPASAIPYFSEAIVKAQAINYTELEIYCYSQLAQTYAMLGNYNQAFKAQSKYLDLNQKMQDKRRIKDMEELQTKYETNKKEQQNKLLSAQYKEQQIILSRNRIGIIALAITILLVIVLFYLLYNRYRLNQQARFKDAMLEEQRLRAQSIMDAEENERQRLARELHDGIGQLLCTVRRQVEFANEGAPDNTGDDVLKMLDESIKEVRDLSHSMMPPYILNKSLKEVIEEFIDRVNYTNKLQIHTEWVSADKLDIDKTATLMLYRSIQEIVSNIFKHAKASSIHIELVNHGDELNLMIIDDGVGFDKDTILNSGKGLGLKNIQSRIAYIGGSLNVDTMPGRGVTYIIELPLNAKQSA
ncbi:tetratricopeptide repeat protein [Inquilinus sp. KBS0705]|nr:tetratricopeptide repeat protein [Inquilinus sp. KBS0705]